MVHEESLVCPYLRNPKLAELANKTIEDNRGLFPNANIKVLAQLSSQVQTGRPATDDAPEAFDLLVTETFGSLLLGESALAFVADASRWTLVEHVLFFAFFVGFDFEER